MAKHPRLVPAAPILGSSMAFIDATAVNVAMPVLQKDLHGSLAGAQWVVESYQLLLASLLLVGGALGDRYGRRRTFTLGVVAFALTSVGCGLAPTIATLVIARALQGVAAALLVPESLAIVAAGVVLLLALARVERTVRSPMLPPALFRSPTFSAANLLTFFLYSALGAAMFFIPFDLIDVQRYSPTQAGAANLPLVVLI